MGRRRYNNLSKQTIRNAFLRRTIILFPLGSRFKHVFICRNHLASLDKGFVDSHGHHLQLC